MPANMYMSAGFFIECGDRLISYKVYQQHNTTKKSHQFEETFLLLKIS